MRIRQITVAQRMNIKSVDLRDLVVNVRLKERHRLILLRKLAAW